MTHSNSTNTSTQSVGFTDSAKPKPFKLCARIALDGNTVQRLIDSCLVPAIEGFTVRVVSDERGCLVIGRPAAVMQVIGVLADAGEDCLRHVVGISKPQAQLRGLIA